MKTTKFTKLFVVTALLFLLSPLMGFAQEVAEVASTAETIVETPVEEGGIDWEKVTSILITVLFAALSLAMIVHMLYVKFIKKDLAEDYTPDTFKQMRAGEGEFVSEEQANSKAAQILTEAFNAWTSVNTGVEGEEIRVPFCRKDIVKSYAAVEEVVKLAPTDAYVIDGLNTFSHDLNESMKRSFDGSKTFIIVSLVIGVVFSFLSGTWGFLGMIGVSTLIYWLASLTPLWMEIRKEVKGNSGKRSFMTRLFGGLLGATAAAETYTVVTEYSDGSTTEETDNSNFWISLVFTIIIMIVMAVLMFFVAAVNYLRNYVIYR